MAVPVRRGRGGGREGGSRNGKGRGERKERKRGEGGKRGRRGGRKERREIGNLLASICGALERTYYGGTMGRTCNGFVQLDPHVTQSDLFRTCFLPGVCVGHALLPGISHTHLVWPVISS